MNVTKFPLTHRVGVGAYLFRGHRMLLLRRANPPLTYAPPGGHLEIGEDPVSGLLREIEEETGLSPRILGAAQVWFGTLWPDRPPLLCINYIAVSPAPDIRLSAEHTEFRWLTRDELARGEAVTLDERGRGYRLEDLLRAFDQYEHMVAAS